jgi:hypothetical protein
MKKFINVASAPLSNGSLQLWAIDESNQLWTRWKSSTDPGAFWTGWSRQGERIKQVAVAPLSNKALQLWAVSTNNELWTCWKSGSEPSATWTDWSRFSSISNVIQVASAQLSDGALQLWIVDTNNILWTCWKNNTNWDADWTDWIQQGIRIKQVAVAPLSNKALQLWAVSTNNELWTCWKSSSEPSATWTDWSRFSSISNVTQAAAAPLSDEALQLWAVDNNNILWTCWKVSTNWDADWTDWTQQGERIKQVAVAPLSDKALQLWAISTNNELWTCWKSNTEPGAFWTEWVLQNVGKTLNLHIKILTQPTIFSLEQMVNAMIDVYEIAGIYVNHVSTQFLDMNNDVLTSLNDIDTESCTMSSVSQEQTTLSNFRDNAGNLDVVVYMCRSVYYDKGSLNGCASFPANRPMAVVASYASRYTLGHEVGHVLGLNHVNDNNRLMTGGGTDNITNPPPDLFESEVNTMLGSSFSQFV